MAGKASLRRDGDALVLTGALDRQAVTQLWPSLAAALSGVRTLDLRGVDQVDSAGVALLVEVLARLRTDASAAPALLGTPTGLAELAAAYRLTPQLDFQASLPPAVN